MYGVCTLRVQALDTEGGVAKARARGRQTGVEQEGPSTGPEPGQPTTLAADLPGLKQGQMQSPTSEASGGTGQSQQETGLPRGMNGT